MLRYVEGNARRAGLVTRAADWPWGGLHARLRGGKPLALSPWPVDVPADWPAVVDDVQPAGELARLRADPVNRGRPLGGPGWVADTAARLGLGSTLRGVGRPRKAEYQ